MCPQFNLLSNFEEFEVMIAKYKPILLLCSESRVTDQINKNEYSIEVLNVYQTIDTREVSLCT